MIGRLNILLVEDSETDADLLVKFLRKVKIDFSHIRVWNKDAFVAALKENNHDLIIADHALPQFSGMEAFRIAEKENKGIPFILVTGTVTENILTEYAKEGVDDYFLKDNLLRLPSAIENLINKKKISTLLRDLETAHREIKDSINYAKKIQNAMLPDTKIFNDAFPESFSLFKPKDILSGDFYLFKEEQDNFFVAVADCTGHGIPGALMSMIGIEKLNNIIQRVKDPAQILTLLNESIENALCKSSLHEQSHDGMDIGLCCIHKASGIVKFSGANRCLWIIRNGQSEIEEIKGTKKGIGGFVSASFNSFESHEIHLKKGDSFYLSSDGYADQFGGERKKKLSTKRFKQMLIGMQDKTMHEQEKYLNQFHEEWKMDLEQVDDILVIGVRM